MRGCGNVNNGEVKPLRDMEQPLGKKRGEMHANGITKYSLVCTQMYIRLARHLAIPTHNAWHAYSFLGMRRISRSVMIARTASSVISARRARHGASTFSIRASAALSFTWPLWIAPLM